MSLPDELQKTLDKRISMGMIGDINEYTRYQTAEAIQHAAKNEGGMAGIGAGLGVGMNMGQVMTEAMQPRGSNAPSQNQQPNQQSNQQQPQAAEPDFMARLTQLKTLLDQGLISQEDYDGTKAKILAQLSK